MEIDQELDLARRTLVETFMDHLNLRRTNKFDRLIIHERGMAFKEWSAKAKDCEVDDGIDELYNPK